ncbi:MAG: SUMF1/EgtB/PvdO family nonheme iron enzyme [Bacteroidales bacterium]|nr:SUMF1/EgtB/PvdO family nonheme iron enzyme [Bacteroidales bacterium]
MKKVILLVLTITVLITACGPGNNGELVGVPGRKKFFEPEPFEMAFIPAGNFITGPSDQDAMFAMNSVSRSVTIDAFWMDQTEITNNKYRQFVYWVRDSIMRTMLGEAAIEGFQFYRVDEEGVEYDPPVLNWDEEIDLEVPEIRDELEEMYYSERDRFNNKKQIDVRKLNYSYFWVDYKQAAKAKYDPSTSDYEGQVQDLDGNVTDVTGRSDFIMEDEVNVYPDTLAWIRDFTYSYNEPHATIYFWHPSFDDYPVVGVTWKQATAFSVWRTDFMNSALRAEGMVDVQNYRLPLETEWEYAARGGLDLSMYPWGGPYTRNYEGCFLANFKPLRGNYIDDGAAYTAAVASYEPNEFGLYDMAGNVAEWTSSAYHPSSYIFSHDLNPDYKYNAKPDDDGIFKRKVIRGGSWKDIGYFLQVSTRDYEFQDSAKCFIGFRNVRSYIGVE